MASRGWVGETIPDALLMKEIVARTRDGEVPRDVATHKSLYTISHCRSRSMSGRTFQDVERK